MRLCDAFNLPIVSLVDTPGFLPGKDLEWRGMIRHGAELAFAYAQATVPRLCLILRKAFGGAYIVMDSRGIGNDICLAWPGAEVAVMGASGAVQILHRELEPGARGDREADTRRPTSTRGRPRSGGWSTRSSTRRTPGSCCARCSPALHETGVGRGPEARCRTAMRVHLGKCELSSYS